MNDIYGLGQAADEAVEEAARAAEQASESATKAAEDAADAATKAIKAENLREIHPANGTPKPKEDTFFEKMLPVAAVSVAFWMFFGSLK